MSVQSVAELLAAGETSFSFEFFPPKTDDGERALWQALRELEPLRPTFVSVTYGAGGTTRDRTVRVTGRIAAETTMRPVAHLTCVGATVEELRGVVAQYAAAGVHDILALRGDPPGGPGTPWTTHPGGLAHADELVALIRTWGDFHVGVAAFPEGHPEAASLDADAEVLAHKQSVGAAFAVTQFFFRVEDYFTLVERARQHGATLPIVPGLMPVTALSQIERFAQLQGSAFPEELGRRFRAVADDDVAVRALGVEVATEMGRELLAGDAPGLHFFTMNRSTSTREVYANLVGDAARR